MSKVYIFLLGFPERNWSAATGQYGWEAAEGQSAPSLYFLLCTWGFCIVALLWVQTAGSGYETCGCSVLSISILSKQCSSAAACSAVQDTGILLHVPAVLLWASGVSFAIHAHWEPSVLWLLVLKLSSICLPFWVPLSFQSIQNHGALRQWKEGLHSSISVTSPLIFLAVVYDLLCSVDKYIKQIFQRLCQFSQCDFDEWTF